MHKENCIKFWCTPSFHIIENKLDPPLLNHHGPSWSWHFEIYPQRKPYSPLSTFTCNLLPYPPSVTLCFPPNPWFPPNNRKWYNFTPLLEIFPLKFLWDTRPVSGLSDVNIQCKVQPKVLIFTLINWFVRTITILPLMFSARYSYHTCKKSLSDRNVNIKGKPGKVRR